MENSAKADWKKLRKNNFTVSDLIIIAVNLVPLLGVWFWEWNAKEMFLVYCLESVIAGLYNVLLMAVIGCIRKRDVWNDTTGTIMPSYAFIIFFIVHYGFFLFIQLGIFISILKFPGLDGFSSGFDFLFHFPKYLSKEALMVLLGFVFSYGVMLVRKYIWSGAFRTVSLGMIMFLPYPRIFVQQFVVILGSFVLLFGGGASKIFMLVFVTIKVLFEIIIDFDRLLNESQKDTVLLKD
jgi:asparagine N-glycosylation enzyme membrane subunit Stt3